MNQKLAEWTTAYINNLPDAAFAVIEPAYQRGDTEDKNCRHLPHHSDGVKDGSDSNDNIDMDHLRNAWQRRNQIKPVSDSISQDELIARAERHLRKHIKDLELDWSEETSRIQFASDADILELIPGQFSLSKSGEGMIRLITSLKSLQTPAPAEPAILTSQPQTNNEFLNVRFRALSQIYIGDYALDFTKEGVLQKAVPLLKNQTVYADHCVSIHNWLGVVQNSIWDAESQPPGIDADLKIDIATNPKVARGLSIQPPAIHSASVTTFFLWSKSHPEMDDNEFYYNLGKEKGGEIVRVIVDEILNFSELSLVWQGADPFAKRKFAASLKSIRVNPRQNPYVSVDSAEQNQGGPLDPQEQIKQLQASNALLQKEKETANIELAALKPDAEFGKKYLEQLRNETESLYRLLNGAKVNEDFVNLMIRQAPFAHLEVLKKDYETLLLEKLFFTCPHCGKEIKSPRRSKESVPSQEKPNDKSVVQHKL